MKKLPKNIRAEELKGSTTIVVEGEREVIRNNQLVIAEKGNGGRCSCNRCSK